MRTLGWIALGVALVGTASARAQTPPPVAPVRAPAADPAVDPGARVATGQAPVVGGNAAGARERALDDAIRQVVDLAVGELCDPPTRAAQAKAIRALEAKARTFVGRYRTLEEGEANGLYTIRIEAEVDLPALRKRIERWSAGPAVPPPARAPLTVAIVPGDPTRPTLAAAVSTALASTGAQVVDPSAGSSAVVRMSITETVTDEGPLRGTGLVAAACQADAVDLRAPAARRHASARGFAATPAAAGADCEARLGRALAGEIATALAAQAGPAADLATIRIDADVVEPAAVAALLKSVRSVGAVSAADLVQVGGGQAEIRARTRSAAGPLAAALTRDADATLALSDVQISGGAIRLRARLRPPPPPRDREQSMTSIFSRLSRQVRLWAVCLALAGGACAHTLPSEAIALRVECNVPDATLWIDDLLAGAVSQWNRERHRIPAGFHRIEIRHPGYYSFFQEVDLPSGGQTVVTAKLRELLD